LLSRPDAHEQSDEARRIPDRDEAIARLERVDSADMAAASYKRQGLEDLGFSGFAAISAGGFHSIGLKADGTAVVFGDSSHGMQTVPPPSGL
jgi:hypothetical protein